MAQGPDRTLPDWGAGQAGVHPRKSRDGFGSWAPRALAKARGVLRPRRSHMLRREGRAVLSATKGRLARLWKRCRQIRRKRRRQLSQMNTVDSCRRNSLRASRQWLVGKVVCVSYWLIDGAFTRTPTRSEERRRG